ncbi:MAG: hypothetical protein AAF567_12395 [Actinomycetota bacterium]
MSITERERRDLYYGLEQALGQAPAETLMKMLPDRASSELVTKDDLRVTTAELRSEMADIRADMANIRTEMADLRTELKTEMVALQSDLETKMTRWMATIMTGNGVAVVTALLA